MEHVKADTLTTAMPINSPVSLEPMTKAQKRERWAQLLEKCPHPILLTNGLEYVHAHLRDGLSWPQSPMSVAFADKVLRDAGLKGETVGDSKKFFEMTDQELHAISCNCGGYLSGRDMASRIRQMGTWTTAAVRFTLRFAPFAIYLLIVPAFTGVIWAMVYALHG